MSRALSLLFGPLYLASCAAHSDSPWCEPDRPCAVASEARCAHGPEAARHGRSAFADGTCIARDDDACAASTLTCAVWGQCHAPPPDHSAAGCTAVGDVDFAASRDPRCTTHTCLALADDDCRGALACSVEGRCTARDGVCVASGETCPSAELCLRVGACALVGDRCRAGSADDCAQSEICRRFGKCYLSRGECHPCSRAPACRAEGLCHHVEGRCAATIPEHCKDSAACAQEGRCRLSQGACVH